MLTSLSRPWQLLLLSAKTDSELKTATVNLVDYLKQHRDFKLADVAYTLQREQKAFKHRRMVVCRDIEDAIAALEDPRRVLTNVQETEQRPVAFMFPGLGTHYVNMAWELYQGEPMFREQVDYCCKFLNPLLLGKVGSPQHTVWKCKVHLPWTPSTLQCLNNLCG